VNRADCQSLSEALGKKLTQRVIGITGSAEEEDSEEDSVFAFMSVCPKAIASN